MFKTPMRSLGLCAALSLSAVASAQTAPVWGPSQVKAEVAQAVLPYRGQQFAGAFGRFAHLADLGHAPSAYLALSMVRDGAMLYGSHWYASPSQLKAWAALVAEDTRQTVAQAGE